jgi:hypothetical protein
MPKGFPIVHEDDEFPEEIRQMIVGRYRVLFNQNAQSSRASH